MTDFWVTPFCREDATSCSIDGQWDGSAGLEVGQVFETQGFQEGGDYEYRVDTHEAMVQIAAIKLFLNKI